MTDRGRFVGREEAADIAEHAQQRRVRTPTEEAMHGDELHSGDVNSSPEYTGARALKVRDHIPNRSSIASSLTDYEVLPGIQQIPISEFDSKPTDLFYAKDDLDRVRKLTEEIRQSGEINPLIVVQDAEGYYVLEGGHRLGALHNLGQTHVPALVVRDLESLP